MGNLSLTSIIRAGFARVIVEAIPIPKDYFQGSRNCIVEPKTKNYSIVGTAFDYLLRSYLKFLHPDAVEVSIIGLHSFKYVENVIKLFGKVELKNKTLGKDDLRSIERVVKEYLKEKEEYLANGKLTRRYVELTISFARLDSIYRASMYDDVDAPVDERDIDDLIDLYNIVPDELKNGKGKYLLNPDFREVSSLVGGADVDLIIGNTMIDVKTTKEMKLDEYTWSQLVGYLMLADEARSRYSDFPYIENIGIYYSRYGKLWTIGADYVRSNSDYQEVKEKLLSYYKVEKSKPS
ncbi:hypothetical protein BFU36_11860 [Sulfolobus sp. A20]|nr:hypothetical protein BFU36_11860 [Sulfolobus sp. A20]TRM74128.1 hypothetical protein DJ532_13565 [Sulfolobus sp. A20-N-F8]TRM76102.1 hypothetical protein DJ523_01755 [Sulfolobus sp. E5]TRM80572.1 hypothetical protein DJ524_07145 [Sulfolobus sp. D5]TRM83327.1 hypothetical protein DJ531_06005 [Sulfolobus sp. A20-N-F6]TRM87433.1 hypothetical protein DJ529_08475 [Sulfolobus sp. C3]TRM97747.1 hypothetical protein DMP16_01500 [Sulfolobus sp. B1]TRN03876.1 hypothetical protein DJ530_02170 [Sulfo